MPTLQYNQQLLQQFEQGLDPKHPQNSKIPVRVLGYGEISTTLEIGAGNETRLAYKRVPMFHTEQELDRYEALYRQYIQLMNERVGIRVIASDITRVLDERRHKIVGYIVQEKLPLNSICNNLIHHLSPEDVARLVRLIMIETAKVFDFNQQNRGRLELAIDGQVSNWAIANIDPNTPGLPESIELTYFDTSSPFISIDGIEQADPELFLRSAPSFLVWILRLLFLQDVMTRYYDFRKVSIDLVANFYKEQRPELVPGLVDTVNEFFSSRSIPGGFKPVTADEVRSYYREDAWIWRLYLYFRKIDRTLHHLLGKYYPYILPAKIKR
jgi:hypothetical protein